MGNMTEHFDREEFNCQCGKNEISKEFVERLEKLFKLIGADYILISSGYRCPSCSVKVGGYSNDMHTKGGAADLVVYKDGKPISSYAVCAIAETTGLFNGIAVIDDCYVHLDIRGDIPYSNSHWYGNEQTGENYATFRKYLPVWFIEPQQNEPKKRTLKIYIDNDLILEKEI